MDIGRIIKKPIITEKAMQDAKLGKFTFQVAREAKKPQIRQAVEDAFSVHVVGMSTIIVKGKTQRVGTKRREIRLAPWKKAIVKLKTGEKIDLFDVGGDKK